MIKQENILRLLKAGDEKGIELLFTNYFKPLCVVAYRIVGDEDTAKDVVQDVFVKLWDHRDRVAIKTSLFGYLKQSVVNHSIDHQRKGYVLRKVALESEHQEHLQSSPSEVTAHQAEGSELGAFVQRAIEQLPERCRLVFNLSRHEGLSYKEIAESLDISVKTVENQMTKALKTLRKLLAPVLTLVLAITSFIFFFNQT